MKRALLVVAGTLLLLSAGAHGFLGWPAVRKELETLGAGADAIGGMGAGWLFGTACMAAFGLIVLLAALRLGRGGEALLGAVRIIAACYIVFGLAAFIELGLEPHFIGFIVIGLIAGTGSLGSARRA